MVFSKHDPCCNSGRVFFYKAKAPPDAITGSAYHRIMIYWSFMNGSNKKLSNDVISSFESLACGDPYGNRTHDYAVKGRRLSRLTNGPENGCDRI